MPAPSISSNFDRDNLITQLNVRQPLWTAGRLTANVNQALYDERAAQVHILEQQNTIAKNTIDIWQSYLHAKELQLLLSQNLKKLIEFEAMMSRRVASGVSAHIELDLVTNRILQEHNSYQAAKEQERIALVRLAQITGSPINPSSRLEPHLAQVISQSVGIEPLALNAQGTSHPSVLKQAHQVLAAESNALAKKAARYPSVYAQYQYQYNPKGQNHSDFSIGLSYDLESGLASFALADAADHQVASLRQSQEATRRTIAENIATQYQQFASAKDQQKSLQTAVKGGSLVLQSYERQFIAGRKNWLDVLNAAREESQYKQQLLQTQIQMIGAFYKLQIDLGQMPWQHYEPAPLPPVTISDAIDTAIFSINPNLAPPAQNIILPHISQQSPSEQWDDTSDPEFLFIDDALTDTPSDNPNTPIIDDTPSSTAGTTL